MFPARAGMTRSWSSSCASTPRVPRACGDDPVARVLKAKWTPSTSEDSKQLATRLGKLTAAVSGGTAVTEVLKHDPSDAADGLTSIGQDGALGTVAADGLIDQHADDQRVGYLYHPTPEEVVSFVSGEVVSMGLLEAPSAPIALRPLMIIEVIG